MMRVGLTGGIGSGKSLVAKVLECLQVPVYHADNRSKEMLGSEKLKPKLIELFGVSAISPEGIPDRKAIASIVFTDTKKLAQLNALLHPLVRGDFDQWCQIQSVPYVVQEAAILYESGFSSFFDKIIVVTAPEELCISRVVERDHVTPAQVQQRMQNQWPSEKKESLADFVLVNDGKQMLLPAIIGLHNELLSLASALA